MGVGNSPAVVPALKQNRIYIVCRSKVNILLSSFRGGSMPCILAPGIEAKMHAPPYTDILARLNPGDVLHGAWLIQVQDKAGIDEVNGLPANLDGAPRRYECPGHDGLLLQVVWAVRRKCCRKDSVVTFQCHFREIHQRSLVDAAIQTVIGTEGHGRIGILQLINPEFPIFLLIAVKMRRNGPGETVLGDIELSEFIGDDYTLIPDLIRNLILIPEPDPVIENPET